MHRVPFTLKNFLDQNHCIKDVIQSQYFRHCLLSFSAAALLLNPQVDGKAGFRVTGPSALVQRFGGKKLDSGSNFFPGTATIMTRCQVSEKVR
jgi:hypothetical protein